ncbi:hypothetical protein FOL47_000162 [Perkinsus chesapeaki]|uniref:Protein arginine N-methyltransferase domain-containing protein n=1 Tax=Perkinsus chesapeaki TaxID=330153 RepID=A0A7J6MMD7_PERCH|nr:hypothetical protein FOL47_000162 [Perkinsus chesapeaki]
MDDNGDKQSSESVAEFFADFTLGQCDSVSSRDYYFDSYAHREAYEELLKDNVHTDAYRKAILFNKHLFEGKRVLVVRSGLGILPYLVAEAGAELVIAQEKNLIGRYISSIAKSNHYSTIVSALGDITDPEFKLPYGLTEVAVDIIVSEPMGYTLLHESRIKEVLVARDRFLKPGGKMFPNKFTMNVCALAAPEEYSTRKRFWEDMWGFDFTNPCLGLAMANPIIMLASEIGQEKPASGEHWQKSELTSEPAEVFAVDLLTAPVDITGRPDMLCGEFTLSALSQEEASDPEWLREDFHDEYSMARQAARVDGLVLWFDVKFDHGHVPVEYSTGPEASSTCWAQTILRLPPTLGTDAGGVLESSPAAVIVPGEHLYGRIAFRQSNPHRRDLDIKVSMEDGRGGNAVNAFYTLQ